MTDTEKRKDIERYCYDYGKQDGMNKVYDSIREMRREIINDLSLVTNDIQSHTDSIGEVRGIAIAKEIVMEKFVKYFPESVSK